MEIEVKTSAEIALQISDLEAKIAECNDSLERELLQNDLMILKQEIL